MTKQYRTYMHVTTTFIFYRELLHFKPYANVVELRRATIHLLISMLPLPMHYAELHVQVKFYKLKFGVVLSRGCAVRVFIMKIPVMCARKAKYEFGSYVKCLTAVVSANRWKLTKQ